MIFLDAAILPSTLKCSGAGWHFIVPTSNCRWQICRRKEANFGAFCENGMENGHEILSIIVNCCDGKLVSAGMPASLKNNKAG